MVCLSGGETGEPFFFFLHAKKRLLIGKTPLPPSPRETQHCQRMLNLLFFGPPPLPLPKPQEECVRVSFLLPPPPSRPSAKGEKLYKPFLEGGGGRDDRRGAIKQPSYSGGGGGSHRRLRVYVEEDVWRPLFLSSLFYTTLAVAATHDCYKYRKRQKTKGEPFIAVPKVVIESDSVPI